MNEACFGQTNMTGFKKAAIQWYQKREFCAKIVESDFKMVAENSVSETKVDQNKKIRKNDTSSCLTVDAKSREILYRGRLS